ncbi:hypothetical protein JHD49_04455 [Sulfurimonas sp. SAG-AH-194-C21]|nr:hypothetical protein [Sulfurimonas sp. SAG-AH-194-C21]MDF1883183.1 hypothetical protein [Sulfurimonas sp. SAG-AH-194-C21]
MKNKNILTLLLLFVMSFQVFHAYIIDELDVHACSVSEYVQEFSQPVHLDEPNDICNIHSGFHLAFIVPQNLKLTQTQSLKEQPYSHLISYDYDATKTFLIPPRHV